MSSDNNALNMALIIGSGVNALKARAWNRDCFRNIIAINNAWRIRPDWNVLIHPDDFPRQKMPETIATNSQIVISAADYVPVQNSFGGFVYAGATMAFTAGYWALGKMKPDVIAFVGCDMVYPQKGKTHFYGKGTADPLRQDLTLQSLEAKSVRLMHAAASKNCLCINLSNLASSRLLFPKITFRKASTMTLETQKILVRAVANEFDCQFVSSAQRRETDLSYMVPSGRYWEEAHNFDRQALSELDDLWLASVMPTQLGATVNSQI
jgi:hypothetical protein